MRNFIVVLCTSVFLFVMPTAVHANENLEIQKEEKAKTKKGLVGGLLQQVESTVGKTVKSTGNLVEETVKFTGDTVDRTVNFTTETVNTVVDPKQKKPVKTIVENTTDFVGETVEKTVPVVEQTTKTVQTVTNETLKVTKPLPKVPVVTPAVEQTTQTVEKVTEQVKKTVDDTVGTVTETVSKPLKKKPVEGTSPIVEAKPEQGSSQATPTVKPNQPSEDRPPTASESPAGTTEAIIPSEGERPEAKPEADTNGKAPAQESVKEDTTVSKGHAITMESEEVNSVSELGAKPIENQFTMERKAKLAKAPSTDKKSLETFSSQASPLKPTTRSSWISDVQLVTGTSSIHLLTSSTSAGTSGFGAVLANEWMMNAEIVSWKWYMEDILGTLQCSHAPPGQPPQSTPFLYVI